MKLIIRALRTAEELTAGVPAYTEIDVRQFLAVNGPRLLARNLDQRWAWNVATELGVETVGPAVVVRFPSSEESRL